MRVIDVKPAEEGETEKPAAEEKPVETGNRNGSDDEEVSKKDEEGEADAKEPTTEAPKRDTELDSSDEEATAVDDSVNSIDSNTDIDASKAEVITDAPVEGADKEDITATTVAPTTPEDLKTVSPV